MRGYNASQKGAAAVEFALILLPLLILTFGFIEFGIYVYDKQVITNASREGARAGIVSTGGNPRVTPETIEQIVKDYAEERLITFGDPDTEPVLNPNPPVGYASDAAFGTDLAVTVQYDYSFFLLPNLAGIGFDGHIQATTVMKYE